MCIAWVASVDYHPAPRRSRFPCLRCRTAGSLDGRRRHRLPRADVQTALLELVVHPIRVRHGKRDMRPSRPHQLTRCDFYSRPLLQLHQPIPARQCAVGVLHLCLFSAILLGHPKAQVVARPTPPRARHLATSASTPPWTLSPYGLSAATSQEGQPSADTREES